MWTTFHVSHTAITNSYCSIISWLDSFLFILLYPPHCSLVLCPPCHPQLFCSLSTEGGRGEGGWGLGAGQLQPWQPAWLSCSSLDVTDCRSSLLGPHNPLDCCIKTISCFFAPFQLYRVASPIEEAINNKERLRGREGRYRTIKRVTTTTQIGNYWLLTELCWRALTWLSVWHASQHS